MRRAQCPAFGSYILTSFQFDRCVLLCWLVEHTVIWVELQLSNKCNLSHFMTFGIFIPQWTWAVPCLKGLLGIYLLDSFSFCCPVSAYGQTWWPPFGIFTRNLLWRHNWLKLPGWMVTRDFPLVYTGRYFHVRTFQWFLYKINKSILTTRGTHWCLVQTRPNQRCSSWAETREELWDPEGRRATSGPWRWCYELAWAQRSRPLQ